MKILTKQEADFIYQSEIVNTERMEKELMQLMDLVKKIEDNLVAKKISQFL